MRTSRHYYKNLDKAMQLSTTSTFQVGVPNATDTPLLPANDRRLALVMSISVNTDGYFWCNMLSTPNATGIVLRGAANANPQLVLSLKLHGDMVRCAWFGRGVATSPILTVIEVLGPDIAECNRES